MGAAHPARRELEIQMSHKAVINGKKVMLYHILTHLGSFPRLVVGHLIYEWYEFDKIEDQAVAAWLRSPK
jgi:hypothetical protein